MLEINPRNFKGIPHNINKTMILKVSCHNSIRNVFSSNVIGTSKPLFLNKFITADKYTGRGTGVSEIDIMMLNSLQDNDIISINKNGEISRLWSETSNSNVLYTTDFCNSDCIMCPQITADKNNYYDEAIKIIELLPKNKQLDLCISGGEPTLFKDEYLNLLKKCRDNLPECNFLILTNGKNFEDFSFVKNMVFSSPRKITYAIPLYSANSKKHDETVASTGSFQSSVKGIYNLYKFMQDIEIRIVIIKDTYNQLENLAHFIYWNLPFVRHVAFMGMEVYGNAANNINRIWIEPYEYAETLSKAVKYLSRRLINVSVYNLPLCLLHKDIWPFSRNSISDWKNIYIDECSNCSKICNCAGFFTTSVKIPAKIKAIRQ